jgi:uncharacterized iron-regulated protein
MIHAIAMPSTGSCGGGGASRFSIAGLMAALALAGCATAAGGFVLAQDGNPETQARLVAARASLARVIHLGESHDNPAHHAHQARVLQALLNAGVRPALAFEMLTQDQQREVDEAMRQVDSAAALDARLRWRERGWPDFGMYQPLFELALRLRLPVIAADLDPGTVRRIAKEGLGVLPEAEREQLASRLRLDPEREARLEREIAEAHCGLLPASAIPFMVQAWHARNVVMARHIGQALDEGRRVAVIVGRGHLERGGLPDQLNALRPGTRQLIVDFVEAAADESAPTPGPSYIRWLTPGVDRGDPCARLRRTP